jgi:hypothetical protein
VACPGSHCSNQVPAEGLCWDCGQYLPVMLGQLPTLWTRSRALLSRPAHVSGERSVTRLRFRRPHCSWASWTWWTGRP